jgi:hypothetical protein
MRSQAVRPIDENTRLYARIVKSTDVRTGVNAMSVKKPSRKKLDREVRAHEKRLTQALTRRRIQAAPLRGVTKHQ